MTSPALDLRYLEWLADRTFGAKSSGHAMSLAQWLEPAAARPGDPRQWRHNSTWNLVRQAVRAHRQLTECLDAWEWPSCQAWWTECGGPRWDPYSLAVSIGKRPPTHWQSMFIELLHHPIHPGLALWAYGVWRMHPPLPDTGALTGLLPTIAMDRALRACTLSFADIRSPWGEAWQQWVSAPPPDAAEPDPPGRYPATLVEEWADVLAKVDTLPLDPPVKGIQMRWF